MHSTARIVCLWTAPDRAQVNIDGPTTDDLVDRLDRALELLITARATRITVDLTRMHGPDHDVLELLAAVCHRLADLHGCLHVAGLGRRLSTRPEVTAFPELFGDLRPAG